MARIPRASWQAVMSRVYALVRSEGDDHTLVIAVAGVIRRYYDGTEWRSKDAPLVALSAYRLVVGFTEGRSYSHWEMACFCDGKFSTNLVAEYQLLVWKACEYDIFGCMEDYEAYHKSHKGTFPRALALRSVLFDVAPDIAGYMKARVDYAGCRPETLNSYKMIGFTDIPTDIFAEFRSKRKNPGNRSAIRYGPRGGRGAAV
jgi:hypothetical protein